MVSAGATGTVPSITPAAATTRGAATPSTPIHTGLWRSRSSHAERRTTTPCAATALTIAGSQRWAVIGAGSRCGDVGIGMDRQGQRREAFAQARPRSSDHDVVNGPDVAV